MIRTAFCAAAACLAVLGAAPGWAQVDHWSGPGRIVPDEMTSWHHDVTIQTCNDVRAKIEGFYNNFLKYTDTRDIVTNGPTYAYTHTIPTSTWGLAAGGTCKIRFTITHIAGTLNGKQTIDLHTTYVVADIPQCRAEPKAAESEVPAWDDRRRMTA